VEIISAVTVALLQLFVNTMDMQTCKTRSQAVDRIADRTASKQTIKY